MPQSHITAHKRTVGNGGTVIPVPAGQQGGNFETTFRHESTQYDLTNLIVCGFVWGSISRCSDRPDPLNPEKTMEDHRGRSYIKVWTKQNRYNSIIVDHSSDRNRRRIYDLDVVAIISLNLSLPCPESQ
ncbi:hypothetical protein T10_10862 [Trichinella papuae]|uniref:PiggyBac transposable element-derived protein domain-containing protein n=1 Tax=Trichinella papuae TaxID=268474 RepID=A0A0V1M4E4_9BILA|nr:hypothetical protein T10_10862 [Trichinella papuae]